MVRLELVTHAQNQNRTDHKSEIGKYVLLLIDKTAK